MVPFVPNARQCPAYFAAGLTMASVLATVFRADRNVATVLWAASTAATCAGLLARRRWARRYQHLEEAKVEEFLAVIEANPDLVTRYAARCPLDFPMVK
jgi:hypothetical protein